MSLSSTTETYAGVKFQIENWRWAGVPFYIRTGKRLARNLTEIRVHLKPTPQALFASTSSGIAPNVITIRIQPAEGIEIAFDAKRPGTELRTVTVQANFCYQTSFGSKGPVDYETLLLDSMRGDATLFTRRDEVEADGASLPPLKKHGHSYLHQISRTMPWAMKDQPRGMNCLRNQRAILRNTESTTVISSPVNTFC